MSERVCDPECLVQVESHVDNILIIKLYEFIIQANIDLSADGVVSSSVVAEMLNDDKSSVTENAIRFVWETIRNKMVLKNKKPQVFPIEKLLAAVPVVYFQTHPETVDTLLQLKDETGEFVFLGLADFLGRAARVVLATNVDCQDLCDINAWLAFDQSITIDDVNNAARAGANTPVKADDVHSLTRTFRGVETRSAFIDLINADAALAAGTASSDGMTFGAGGGTVNDQRAVAYATAYGPTSDMGLMTITTAPTVNAAGNVNQAGIVFLVSGSTEAVQISGGLPAVFSYSKGGDTATIGTTKKMLNPGTGWRFTDAVTTAGLLIFNVATKANLLSAGYTEAEIKPEWIHKATNNIVLTSTTGGNATTLSPTSLNTTPIAAAQGRVGRPGFSLKSLAQVTANPYVAAGMTNDNVYTFLVSSSDQASGAMPAIVKITSAASATAFTFTEVLESGNGWYESMALTGAGLTFTLATVSSLVSNGYEPLVKYISAGGGTPTIASDQGGVALTVVIQQTLLETTGLTALSAVAVDGAGFVGTDTANATTGQIWFLVSGKDATVQVPKGKPAIFRYEANAAAATDTATITLIAPGSGFLPSAELAGNLVWTLATESNLLANGYVPVDRTNFDRRNRATSVAGAPTATATRSRFTSNPTYHVKRMYAQQAGKATNPATFLGFPYATDDASLFGTAANYNTPVNGGNEPAPTLAAIATLQLLGNNNPSAKASASQIEITERLLANAQNKPTANTLIFLNRINSDQLRRFFSLSTIAAIVTFIGTVTANDLTPNFNMKYYNILSPVQLSNTDISYLYGLFAVLSTIGYSPEEALKATRSQLIGPVINGEGAAAIDAGGALTAPAQITLRANDFDRFFPNYIKSQPVVRRLSLFSELPTSRVPVTPSGALLLANENIAALYKEIYDNSRDIKSRYVQLVATNGQPYEQQVAERVTSLTSTGTRSIIGIKSIIHNAAVTLQKGSLLTASSGTTGKAVFLINTAIVLAADTTRNIAGGELTLVSSTVGGFASNFTTHPINSDNIVPITPAFALVTLAASNGVSTVYEFSEPIQQSNAFKFGGLVFDEDNLFKESELFASHLTKFYTLNNPTSDGSGAPASGPVTLNPVATAGKYNKSPSSTGPLTVKANLNKLFELVSIKYGVPLWMIMVAAAAGNTTLFGAQKLMIELFNTIIAKKQLTLVTEILNIPKGKWSNDLEPIEVLVSIVDAERAFFIDVKPYIEAVLNFAKSNLFDTVRGVNTKGNALIAKLMEAARDDDDRSNIFLMMGTTPEIQLANLSNILSLIKMPKIKLFNYYFAQFSMAQLIDCLPEIVAQPSTPTASSACTSYWHTLFSSLEGIKKLKPYVTAEILLTYNRSVTPIDITVGTSRSSSTSLVFKPTLVIQAYFPDDTIVAGTIKLNALVADMGLSFI